MKILPIFYLYISKQFFLNFLIIVSIISGILFLSSIFETLRLLQDKSSDFILYIKLVLYKLPFLIEKTIIFIILMSSMLTFVKLTRSNELIVARSFGISIWKVIFPILSINFFIGIFIITIFNPLSSNLLGKFEDIINKDIRNISNNDIFITSNGIWFREMNQINNIVIHAKSSDEKNLILNDITIYILDKNGLFIERIDAKKARLFDNHWKIYDISILSKEKYIIKKEELDLPVLIKFDQLKKSLISPEIISSWKILQFIKILKSSGISDVKYKMHFYKLIYLPFHLISITILAGMFSLRPSFVRKNNMMIFSGLLSGFFIYFFTNVANIFGSSGAITINISVLTPIIIIFFISILGLIHLENS